MSYVTETPHLLGSSKNGGSVIQNGWSPSEYRNPPLPATNLTASIIAKRFGLPIATARVVCELAGIGGAA
ncbi:hypothetical protein [Brucella anthropi]|uniref:Uncharacterized protein n=1 Tax=Brucella anthropi TaxID=529 RepID=A0A6L3Z0C8_BRUAN|nr:hypothetical protein [Brucella anthropi]KAB2763069.1 hypothetical protein F9L04_21785 [Brucella anthropi]UVV67025.1 hypothetical protein NW321_11165 [Brucella anthropi]